MGPPLNLAPDDARRLVEAVAARRLSGRTLDRAELGHLAAALGDRTVESLAHLTAEELAALGADDAQRLRDAIRDRPPNLHDSFSESRPPWIRSLPIYMRRARRSGPT